MGLEPYQFFFEKFFLIRFQTNPSYLRAGILDISKGSILKFLTMSNAIVVLEIDGLDEQSFQNYEIL